MQKLHNYLRHYLYPHWSIVLILLAATWFRVARIETHAIFFGDSAHDLLVAAEAVKNLDLPLLGIESSVPRFRQGPLNVWLNMIIFAVAGYRLTIFSLVYSLLSIGAVIGLYCVVWRYHSQKAALLAAAWLTISPLAIAQGRMTNLITPLPLMMVLFVWSLLRLWHRQPGGLFWAVLAWCGIFQFELAVLPLLPLIPLVWWLSSPLPNKSAHANHKLSQFIQPLRTLLSPPQLKEILTGLGLGLLPRLVYDLTHGFKQLGVFSIWVGYRLTSFILPINEHVVSGSRLAQTAQQYITYGSRMIASDSPILVMMVVLFLSLGLGIAIQQALLRQLAPIWHIAWWGTALLLIGHIIHGQPSEAYFSAYLLLLPLLLASTFTFIPHWLKFVLLGLTITVTLQTNLDVFQYNFWVSNPQRFSYGPSVADQRQMVRYVITHQPDFTFKTTDPGGNFPNYFDNLRWLAQEASHPENPQSSQAVYIEPKYSVLSTFPGITKVSFTYRDVYFLP